MVLLISLTPADKKVYFLKQGKEGGKYYSSKSLDAYQFCKDNLLFLHALTGCDTTSALFRKGKKAIIKSFENKIKKNCKFKEAIESFKHPDQTTDRIIENGCTVLLAMYNAPPTVSSINHFRYTSFLRAVEKKKTAVNLAALPPTLDAAGFHLLRVYFQVQQWLSNDRLDPEKWGWEFQEILVPRKMQEPPAPAEILQMIFCNCKKGCSRACSCKRAGLLCTSVCGSCLSESCTNFTPAGVFDEDDEENEVQNEGANEESIYVNESEEVLEDDEEESSESE